MHLLAAVGRGQAGPLGLLVVVVLVGASVFLFRSMSKQLRKVPPSFEAPVEADEDGVGDTGELPAVEPDGR